MINPNDFLIKAEKMGMRRFLKRTSRLSPVHCEINNKRYLDFSSNNYLALANHPLLIQESIKWTKNFGTGSTASRLVSGTFPEYMELEEKIAEWKGAESAIIIGSGYMANIGTIQAIGDSKSSVIFADKLNHASLNSGATLAKSTFKRYPHLDYEKLEYLLKKSDSQEKIIISDTIFSMDGDICNINKLTGLARKYDAILYLDDAHASGVFGDKGQGLTSKNTQIAMGTFSKALGAYGAYIACSENWREFLINKCGSFIYSTALPPGAYGAISAAVDIVQTEEFGRIRFELHEKSILLNKEIQNIGFNTGNTSTPIIPIILESVDLTLKASDFLIKNGIFVVPIRPPTVPNQTARLRISLNAAHSNEHISILLDLLKKLKNHIL